MLGYCSHTHPVGFLLSKFADITVKAPGKEIGQAVLGL